MKHSEVCSAACRLSPCCLGMDGDLGPTNAAWRKVLHVTTREEVATAFKSGDCYASALTAMASAFSPDPGKPPLFVQFPFREENGVLLPNEPAYTQWQSHFPTNLVREFRFNLLRLKGISFDYGIPDQFSYIQISTRAFSRLPAGEGIPHAFELFDGSPQAHAPERVGSRMLPFFSRTLCFPDGPNSK